MNLFGSRSPSTPEGSPRVASVDVVAKLDAALTEVFSEKGKQTVLYYMNNRYGLSLEQATMDPGRLEKAISEMLGKVGWMVVKRSILEKFWEKRIELADTRLVEGASLRDAFTFVRIFSPGALVGPR